MPALPSILVADVPAAVRVLQSACAADLSLTSADTLEAAVRTLESLQPRAVVVGYHFDEGRPDRFITYIRTELRLERTPVFVVRVLDYLPPHSEERLRSAFMEIGADDFFNVSHETSRDDREEALRRFCQAVRKRIEE